MKLTKDYSKLDRLANALIRHTKARAGHPFDMAESYNMQQETREELDRAFKACIED